MALEHDLSGGFQLVGLVFEVGAGAAFVFAGIAGEFDAINGKHLAPDQALPVTEIEYLAEYGGDVIAQMGNKGGDGGEVRLGIAGQGDEGDVFSTGELNRTAGDEALAVGKQNDFEQHSRWIGGCSGNIILETGIKAGEIQLMVDEVVQGMLKGTREELPLQVDHQKPRAGVDGFVARHGLVSAKSVLLC